MALVDGQGASKLVRTFEYAKGDSENPIQDTTNYINPSAGDQEEVDQRLVLQAHLKGYEQTPENGFIYSPAMIGEPQNPFNQ